jgi:hypothetical protein
LRIGRPNLLTFCYRPVCQLDKLGAAGAHLDGHVAEGGALEFYSGRLAMVGAAEVAELALGGLAKLLHGIRGRLEHGIILA